MKSKVFLLEAQNVSQKWQEYWIFWGTQRIQAYNEKLSL